jgi:hypothetical protein
MRLLLQYLEPPLAAAGEAAIAEHLASALSVLPVTDLALGWRLPAATIAAIRPLVSETRVWRWVPMLSDPGHASVPDAWLAIGVNGRPPEPFAGSADFRFLCPDHDEVVDAALSRAIDLAHELDAVGVMLDRIRWHSPSAAPGVALTCMCERSRRAASADGLDLRAVAATIRSLAGTLTGRRRLVAALLGAPADGVLGAFLAWRCARMTRLVGRLVEGLAQHGLDAALDVFTPVLARGVGQDLPAIGPLARWSKAMIYLAADGPAALPHELRGYATFLAEAGEPDAAGFLQEILGFPAPGLAGGDQHLPALRVEMVRLRSAIGADQAVVGIDAVELPGVCEVSDDDLRVRVEAIAASGLGLSPSWDLWSISRPRLQLIADALDRGRAAPAGA